MPLVQAKCENCGGALQVDNSRKAAICPWCNTPYVVQDAINNYITNIGTLHADVVNVNNDASAKARLDAAEAFMQLQKYVDAKNAFAEVCELTPQDYRGWWGQIRAISSGSIRNTPTKSLLNELTSLYKSALTFAPEQEKNLLERQFNDLYQPLLICNTQRCYTLKKEIAQLDEQHTKLTSSINALQNQDYSYLPPVSGGLSGFVAVMLLIGIIVALVKSSWGIFFLSWIPLLLVVVYEAVIYPVCNSSTSNERAKVHTEINKLTSQRGEVIGKKVKATRELERLSN